LWYPLSYGQVAEMMGERDLPVKRMTLANAQNRTQIITVRREVAVSDSWDTRI